MSKFKVLRPDEKYAKNPRSRKLAIYAKCYDCVGTDQDTGWTRKIGDCPITGCALYPFRPYQSQT